MKLQERVGEAGPQEQAELQYVLHVLVQLRCDSANGFLEDGCALYGGYEGC